MNSLPLEGFVFDMDGVLVNTMTHHFYANRQIAEELGYTLTEPENDEFRGLKRKEVMRLLSVKAGLTLTDAELEELSVRKNQYFQTYLKELSEQDVFPGIVSFLTELKNQHIKMAVASSSGNAVAVLKNTGIFHFFDHVVDVNTVTNGKPHPEIFLTAAAAIGVAPERCAAMEDGKAGMEAIFKTPMFSIGVGDDPFVSQADWYVDTAEELSFNELQERFSIRLPKHYVIGLDGGGTYVRTIVADEKGRVIASVDSIGGAHPGKNPNAQDNVRQSILNVVQQACLRLEQVNILVSGLAGLDRPEDHEWAEKFFEIPGLECPKVVLNDSFVARKAAFKDGIGVIAIAGTGSIVNGFTASETSLRNYDFGHYAFAGARYLTMDLVLEIIAGHTDSSDTSLVEKTTNYLGLASPNELQEFALTHFAANDAATTKLLGAFAPVITQSAANGSRLAQRICQKTVNNLLLGVKLVAHSFPEDAVRVTSFGGVIESSYMHALFIDGLTSPYKKLIFQKPFTTPAYGAVIIGLETLGLPPI